MAAVDPNHPKPYLKAVMVELRRGQVQQAPSLMDRLGPKAGPGRTYGDAFYAVVGGHPDEAVAGFEKALAAYTRSGHLAGQAACHTALGNMATRRSDYKSAAEHFDLADHLLQKVGDRGGLADVLLSRADALLADRQADAAVDSARRAVGVRQEIGGPGDLARALNVYGKCCRVAGKRDEALDAYRRSLELRRQGNDLLGQAACETEIANLHQDAGRLDDAIAHERRALELSESATNQREIARQLRILADLLIAAKRPREAAPLLVRSASIYGEQKNPSDEARTLIALGKVRADLGELRQARAAFEPALAKARAAKDRDAEADCLTGLGNLALSTGDLSRGLIDQEEALRLYREMNDSRGELSSLNNLGAAYYGLGDLSRARHSVDDALAAATRLSSQAAQAQAHNNLGAVLGAQGSYAPALNEALLAGTLWKDAGEESRAAHSRANAAKMLLRLGRAEEAAPLLEGALAEFRESGEIENQAYATNLLGELHLARGSPTKALAAHRQALALAEETDSTEERWSAHAGIAAALEAAGSRREASREMNAALDEVERTRTRLLTGDLKMRFLAERIDLFERALALVLPSGRSLRPEEVATAFAIAERSRSRSLLDALAIPDPRSGKSDDPLDHQRVDARDRFGEALAGLARADSPAARAAARADVDKTRATLERLEIQARARFESERPGSLPEARPVALAKLQQSVLRDDEALLEYFVGKSGAWVFAITKHRASVQALPPPAEIAEKAAAFLESTAGSTAPGPDGNAASRERDASESLGHALIPFELPDGAHLLVAPDGPVHHVPFEALRIAGKFLVETREVAVVPSAATLAQLRGPRSRFANGAPIPAASGLLGVADPALGDERARLPQLPFARREVEGIAALFPQDETKLLIGSDATRSNVLGGGPGRRYLHFATHAWLDPESPRDTGLWLGADPPGKGGALLGVDDILALPLSADLVVVSACRSGDGELLRGEGLAGLTRAFLDAGSRAVVVSLWDVPDQSTADFMVDFYGALVHGQEPAAALRASKLHFLASDVPGRSRVLRWAPFILVGDPDFSRPSSNFAASRTTH